MSGGLSLSRREMLRRGVLEARHAAHGPSVVWGRGVLQKTPVSSNDSASKGD